MANMYLGEVSRIEYANQNSTTVHFKDGVTYIVDGHLAVSPGDKVAVDKKKDQQGFSGYKVAY